MSDPDDRPGVDLYDLGHGITANRLYGFATGSAEVQQAHRVWIAEFVRRVFNRDSRYDVVGLASHLRWRQGDSELRNEVLSLARARAVEGEILGALVRLIQARRHGGQGGSDVILPRFEVRVLGVGTRMSEPDPDDVDAAGHRSVLVVENAPTLLPGLEIRPSVPGLGEHDRFWIKCCGVSSGGLLLGGTFGTFAIRDADNWWQKYFFTSANIGVGAPISWGDPEPPTEGWVEFRTRPGCRVDTFSGWAQIGGASVTVGRGISANEISFGVGKGVDRTSTFKLCRAAVLTDGFSVGISADIAGALFRGDMEPTHDERWRWL